MSSAAEGRPNPHRLQSLTAHLVCADAVAAIDFYRRAFNAVEMIRLMGPDGKLMHAAVRIGDSSLMLAEENPQWGALGPKALRGTPVTIHLQVENADAAIAQAVDAGAKLIMPAADMFWGDRYGMVEDPFGHRWSVAHTLRTLTQPEIEAAMHAMFAQGPVCEPPANG